MNEIMCACKTETITIKWKIVDFDVTVSLFCFVLLSHSITERDAGKTESEWVKERVPLCVMWKQWMFIAWRILTNVSEWIKTAKNMRWHFFVPLNRRNDYILVHAKKTWCIFNQTGYPKKRNENEQIFICFKLHSACVCASMRFSLLPEINSRENLRERILWATDLVNKLLFWCCISNIFLCFDLFKVEFFFVFFSTDFAITNCHFNLWFTLQQHQEKDKWWFLIEFSLSVRFHWIQWSFRLLVINHDLMSVCSDFVLCFRTEKTHTHSLTHSPR